MVNRFYLAFCSGLIRGKEGYLWLLKILLPVSFATALLNYSGLIEKLNFLLEPLMHFLKLPSSAAFPILIGMLSGVYGCIASMAVLSFNIQEMTIIAIFVLIAHNLIQEGIIQAKSGIPFIKSISVRIFTAIVTCMIVSHFIRFDNTNAVSPYINDVHFPSFLIFFKEWALRMLFLCIKIFFILFGVMILIEILKAFNLIKLLVKTLSPILTLMGLKQQTGILWVTGIISRLILWGYPYCTRGKRS